MEKYIENHTDLEGEVWKQIEDTNYYISNKGRLRSDKFIIKLQQNKKTGLMQGMIYYNGKPKLLNIQGWVGKHFLPEPPHERMIIRHKTSDLCDNRVENLTWGFAGINKNIEYHIKVCTAKKARQPIYKYIIKQYTLSGLCIATYVNWDMLAKLGFRRNSIMRAARGNYYKNSDVYKSHRWQVIKMENTD